MESTIPVIEKPQFDLIEEVQEKIKANQKLLRDGKYDEAIEGYRDCCEKARQIYLDDMHHEMAKFYYFYGNAVLFKIEESGEIFGDVVEKVENNKNDEGEEAENDEENTQENPKIQEEQNNTNVVFESKDAIIVDETNTKPSESDKLNPEPTVPLNDAPAETNNNENKTSTEIKNEDVDFLQLAWENLEVARVITEKRYKEILTEEHCNKEEVEKLLRQHAKIHLRLGDLECWKENFQDGLNEYKNALEIREKFENPMFSRDISELHFLIGNAHLYIGKDDCEEEALKSYNEAKKILENNLKKELGIPFDDRNIFASVQGFDKNLVNDSAFDSEAAKDLKGTLRMLYEKIEDTVQQKSEKVLFKIEKEKMKESSLKENNFFEKASNPQENSNNKENILTSFPNPNLGKDKEEVKVVNLGVFGNSRKRPAPCPNPVNNEATKEEKQSLGTEEKKIKLPDENTQI